MRNPLLCTPGLTESLQALFPDRIIPRGPITFLGPFSDDEINQARKHIGLRRRKPYTGPRYRDGDYFALIEVDAAPTNKLMEILTTFLDERQLNVPRDDNRDS
jgi:hypothetical protein